ncbi:MAG: hypothetical protein AAB425_11920, partial [Bdellovibrionota bacterium]
MTLSFRTKLILLLSLLSSVGIGTVGSFFIKQYKNEKISTLLETQASAAVRAGNQLEWLLFISKQTDPQLVENTQAILARFRTPCDATQAPALEGISTQAATLLQAAGSTPAALIDPKTLALACGELLTHPGPIIVATAVSSPLPAFLSLTRGPQDPVAAAWLTAISIEPLTETLGIEAFPLLMDQNGE